MCHLFSGWGERDDYLYFFYFAANTSCYAIILSLTTEQGRGAYSPKNKKVKGLI